jgi:hypothetical protein
VKRKPTEVASDASSAADTAPLSSTAPARVLKAMPAALIVTLPRSPENATAQVPAVDMGAGGRRDEKTGLKINTRLRGAATKRREFKKKRKFVNFFFFKLHSTVQYSRIEYSRVS